MYFGGSQNKSFLLFFKKEKEKFNLLKLDDKEKFIDDFLNGKFYGGVYQPFFYAMSGKIIENYLTKNDELTLEKILKTENKISPIEFITKYLNVKNPKKYLNGILK